MYKIGVKVFVDSTPIEFREFHSEKSALKFANEMQDSGFKVRIVG